ncbi:NAD(P)H-binding protein [Lentzea sp. NPDC005914]|uniref:NAD(P)H-binding protein n=1 Tax=Lentzea sp. NPDC005914 TaxID=3154572 RepID=UPI0033D8A43A
MTAPQKPVIDHDEAAVLAARAAGVRRLVKLSAISASEPGSWHHRSEQPTRDSGLGWTVLRPGSFASNLLHYAPMIKNGDPVPNWTSAGAIGVIDPRDVAAVATEVLTSADHTGQEYVLTGPQLLTFDQQIAVLNEVLGKEIRTQHVALDAAHHMMLRDGTAPETAKESVAGMAGLAEGRYAFLTDEVPKILGRPATSFAAWVHAHQEAFH